MSSILTTQNNAFFHQPGTGGPSALQVMPRLFNGAHPQGSVAGIESAALHWNMQMNGDGSDNAGNGGNLSLRTKDDWYMVTTLLPVATTKVLPHPLPLTPGATVTNQKNVILVATSAMTDCNINQVFSAYLPGGQQTAPHLRATAWVYVISGKVRLTLGTLGFNSTSAETPDLPQPPAPPLPPHWQKVSVAHCDHANPPNQISIGSVPTPGDPASICFIVHHVTVEKII